MDYKDIIGHEKEIEMLKRAIENKNISHSYLFEGKEGIGKKMVAYVFSKTLLCKKDGREPCNRCVSCMKFDRGSHPDFHMIEPEKGMIRRGEIEDLIKEMSTSPFESKRKVFIIDDSDLMNIESKNTILKTLEEPPSYVNIILISGNPNNLLPTILSRVENIKFYPIVREKIKEFLIDKYKLKEIEAEYIAEFTKGGIGKSIKLIEGENFFRIRDKVIEIVVKLGKGDKTRAFRSIEFFERNKEIIDDILDIIIYWFRDLLIYKEIGENPLIINKDKIVELSENSYMNFKEINDIIRRVKDTKINIKRNINYQLAIETMLLNI